MRYFTPELYSRLAYNDEDTESEFSARLQGLDAAMVAYTDRRSKLAHQLQSVDQISHPFYVNDGLLVNVAYGQEASNLSLTFRIGNLIVGYSDLTLTYTGAVISQEDLETLAAILETTKPHQQFEHKLYCHEFDVMPNGMIKHSMLFCWDALSVSIACTVVTPTLEPKPDRDFRR